MLSSFSPGARIQEGVLGAVLSPQVCGFKLLLGQCPAREAVAVVRSFLKLFFAQESLNDAPALPCQRLHQAHGKRAALLDASTYMHKRLLTW